MHKVNINRSIQPNQCKRGSITLPLFFSSVYAKKKKHQVSAARLSDLKREDNIYIICCITPDCTCQEYFKKHCHRGFFSLFLQTLYGIRFSIRHTLHYYIDFGNGQYAYSDPEKFDGDRNFWNYYFEQPLQRPDVLNANVATINLHYETYPLRIWNNKFIKELHNIFTRYVKLNKDVKATIDNKLIAFKQKKILGVHIRGSDHFTEIEPVSIKMAKEQNLSLNPTKISGICGRLMCCLKYEHETYEEILERIPDVGAIVMTPKGRGVVVDTNVLLEKVKVKVKVDKDTEDILPFNLEEIKQK